MLPPNFFKKGITTIFKELLINEQINANEVRLIDENGEQLGIVSYNDAMAKAEEKGLDLVMMSGASKPPVCKILNYGKYKYEAIKKEKEIRKAQKIVEIKEVRLSMTIEEYDIEYRVKSAIKFLQAGDKVKLTLKMKGRQQAYSARAVEIINDFVSRLSDYGYTEKAPESAGRNVFVVVNPK